MKLGKVLVRASFILFSALCLLLFQLANSILLASPRAHAFQPFPTVPPADPDFEAPIEELEPLPTPIPTVGPGQSFTEDQNDLLPEVLRPDLLDSEYGYSEILGRPGLFLVWSTDDFGAKRYFVLEEGNIYLQQIMTAVDGVRQDFLEMRKELPLSRAIAGTFLGLGLGAVGVVCGVGAIISLAATPISAPVTGALTACAGGAFTLSAGSFSMALDGIGRIVGHVELADEARSQIRGAFLQIPYLEQP